jgi:small nuclear ribonucleoprotein (snRNP)-like protein
VLRVIKDYQERKDQRNVQKKERSEPVRQIQDYKGHKVKIEFKDGRMAIGILAYYHYDAQVIHLTDAKVINNLDEVLYSTEFMVINRDMWDDIFIID